MVLRVCRFSVDDGRSLGRSPVRSTRELKISSSFASVWQIWGAWLRSNLRARANRRPSMTLKDVTNFDTDRLFDVVGSETKRSTGAWLFPALTAFGVGLLVGAGVGLMLAPKSGRGLREDLRERLRQSSDGFSDAETLASLDPDMAGA